MYAKSQRVTYVQYLIVFDAYYAKMGQDERVSDEQE